MRAIRFDEYGDYDVLRLVDVPEPEPGPDEIVVKMSAAPVNARHANVSQNHLDNPKTAVWEFLKHNDRFEIDKSIAAKLVVTVARDGYLRCVKD